jgi:hypothetical protein
MSKLGILGAAALSLSLAAAVPAVAQARGGHFGGGGGMHMGGGGMHMGAPMGGGHMGGAGFRGAQASIGGAPAASTFAGRGSSTFAQGGYRHGDHDDGWRGRGYGPGYGFAAGLAAGSALGYGYGGYYDPYYYGDDYAYDDGYYVDAAPVVVSGGVDPAYCAQRYRSYDPASGTYLGYDGLRHPCGE